MKTSEVLSAWSSILSGRAPSLSIEITKECPLRCPGCYAFDAAHLGSGTELRQLSDFKGDALVQNVLAIVDERKPLHVSLVGGDPLVRYRELEQILPEMEKRGIHTQVVTSAFRVVPAAWRNYKLLNVVVSIDGLQPEHDERRKPATYERILKSIAGARVYIHCTITSQIVSRPGYLEEFLQFWTAQDEIEKVWFSLFTPQRGATDPEILSRAQRLQVLAELKQLRLMFPKLDMSEGLLDEIISADLKTKITPCQFGGDPDCSQCGCIASMGLAAVGHYKLAGPLTAGQIFMASDWVGKRWRGLKTGVSRGLGAASEPEPSPFKVL
jgi:MoaA/NifB/PqqE/SkfB family radical SAM enzyme